MIQVAGRDVMTAFQLAHPVLMTLDETVAVTKEAEEVRQGVREAERELLRRIERLDAGEEVVRTVWADNAPLKHLAMQFDSHDDRTSLHRILYQVDREMRAFMPLDASGASSISGEGHAKARHLRVPIMNERQEDSMLLWFATMEAELATTAPLMLVLPLQERWIDVIVGEPSEAQVKCLRTGPRAIPLASEVPYELDDVFIKEMDERISGTARDRNAVLGKVPSSSAGDPKEGGATSFSSVNGRLWIGSTVAIALVLIVLVVGLFINRGPTIDQQRLAIMDTNWSWVLRDEEGREQLRVLLEEGAGQSVGDAIAAVDDDEVDARNAVERLRVIRSATSAWLDEFAKLGDRFAEQDWRSAAVEIGERVEDVRVVLASEELFEFEAGDDFRVRVQAASEAFRRAGGIAREWEAFTPTVESSGLARHVGLDVESLVSRELEEASLEELPEVLEEYRDVFHRVEERWGQVDASLEKIDQYAGQDPVLGDVRRFVHEQLQGVDSLDAVFRHLDEELHPRLEEMAGLASDRWAEDVDQPYFLANANLPEKIAGVETLREWIDQIGMETYTLLAEHEDPREQRFEAWQDEINELHAELEALSTDGVSEEIARRLSAYEEGKSDLQRIDWNGTRARRDEIEAQLGQLERSHFAPLLAQMDTERDNLLARCRERLAALDAPWPSGVSTALFEEIWDDRRDRLREGDETDCVGRLAELSRVQQTLRDLDERMANTSRLQIPPTSSRIDKRSIEEIISEKRMNLVEGVEEIDWSDQTQVRVFLDEQSARQKAHDAWVSRVSDFLNDASRFDLAVSEARGWEERFDGDETPASLYGRLQEQEDAEPLGMSGAFERLLHSGEAWETVSGMSDRAALLERVDDEGEALAVRMEAWRRLEEFVNREHENAIGDELAVRRALLDAIEELDELRAGELREELKVGLRERWLAYARAAETEAWLENAFANMDQAIGWDELAESDAPLAFDAVLFGLRRFVRADDNGEVREEVDRKIEKMRDLHHLLDGEHAERASVMLAELESALKGTADETADETVDVSEVGPARIGWEVEIEEDGEVLRFEPPAGWTRSHPLYFRRLSDMETTDGHAVYLCTTEVSVGLFIDAVTHAGEWAAVRELLGDTHEENGSDLRRGPRTWEWGADGEMKVSEQWLWFQDGEPADYYAADPGEPSVDHPMQYVSVSAAWYVAKQLGTRLPTASEWREAYEMVGGDIASELANLRDQTWAQQR
ncbi:MAG: hypothetical protein EA377_08615, partial [Phycisphaerales bacterium]